MTRSFQPLTQTLHYRGGTWARRVGRGMGLWLAKGIRIFGGIAMLWTGSVKANPVGEQVVGGSASFNRPDASTLIINQHSDRAVINWNNFSIANGELTRFVQPSSTSAAFNRVVTLTPSLIDGALQANGQVWLANPNGIMIGKGGTVNVGSFVASTHDIATDDFMRGGDLTLRGNSDAAILNQGHIEAQTGDVYLVAKQVKNEGQLMARDGTVGMVSGTEVSLQAVGQGNYKIRLWAAEDGGQKPGGSGQDAEIVNEGVIQAANAVLEAKGSYLPMAIKNTGLIEATGVKENGDGTVSLTGGEGDILNTGVVAALQRSLDGQKETGGSILMAGKNVTSDPGAIITAAGRDGGGTVKLRSSYTTELRGEISVVGGDESAKGGQVQLLGKRVGLFDQAKVDASGGAGGGEVLVGGDYLGKNPEVPNAKAVVMAPTAEIHADAENKGDGGKVILWADEYTGFYGNIFALGGLVGGSGGFVETSSTQNLQARGLVDASAPRGSPGTWLLDPGTINIESSGTTTGGWPAGPGSITYTAPANPSTVLNTDITGTLNSGVNVTIQTGNGAFDINVNADVLWGTTLASYNNEKLTLIAGRDINLNNGTVIGSSNVITAGTTTIELRAERGINSIIPNPNDVYARIISNGSVTLSAATGDIILPGSNDFSFFSNDLGTVSASAPLGNITINEFDTINLVNVVAGGTVTITAGSRVGGDKLGGLSGTDLIVTAGSNIILAGSNNFGSINLSAPSSTIYYNSVAGGFNITGVTGSNVRISETTGDVTQTAAIGTLGSPVSLAIGGGANFFLDEANYIDTLAIFGNSQVLLTSATSLSIGSVTVVSNPFTLTSTTDRGILNTTQSVRLTVAGNLSQTQPIQIPDGIFAAEVTGTAHTITLENESNDVGSLLMTSQDGDISFLDLSDLVVLGLTAGGTGSDIGLQVNGGEVTSAPGGFGGLNGLGNFVATDDGVALLGGANFRLEILDDLGNPLNDVRKIGIDMLGNNSIYLFRNLDKLEIANVSANGLSANGVLGSGGSGFVTLTAGGDITQSASIAMQKAGDLGQPGVGGTLYARTRFDLFKPISTANTADITLTDAGNQLGNVLLETLNFAGDRAAYGLIQYRDQDGINVAGIRSAWNATLQTGISTNTDPNTQSGPIVLGLKEPGQVPLLGFGGLLLLGERGYDLADGGAGSLGNDIDYLSANIPGYNSGDSNRILTYTDKGPFEIYWVNQNGNDKIDATEPNGIISSGVLTLRARDGNPDLVNQNFPIELGGQQGITISTYKPLGAPWAPAVVQARGPITITVEDGQSLRPVPVRNSDGVFNMNFGTTLVSLDTDTPDVSGITITADNMSLNGSVQALTGVGNVKTQNVILQPFTGSAGDPLVANRNVVIGTKLGRPTSQLELLQNELRTVNADTLQIQTASRTMGSAAGGPYAIDVAENIGLIGTEAGGGVGTFRLRANGDVNLGGQITSVANSSGATAPLNVSLNAGDAATAGQVYAKAGITTLNGFIDLAGTDILIADNLNAGTGLVALRPTRFFGLTDLIGGLEDPLLARAGGGFNPNMALTVTIGAPSGAGGVQAVGKAVISTANATYGQLAGVSIQDSGSGYLGGPATVTITPLSATGVSHIESGGVASVLLTNGGSGYTTVPNVTFSPSDQGGTLATGVAVIDQTVGSPTFGQVIQINMTSAGTGYTRQPTVTIDPALGAGNGIPQYTLNPATAYSSVGGALAVNLGSEPGLGTALGILPSELALITAQTIQVGAFALDTYPLIGGGSPVGHPFITGSAAAPTFNTGKIVLSDNINVGSKDLVLVTTAQVQNRFQNKDVPSTLDQALAITAGGLGVISTGGYPNYPEATVQLYGPNQIDRLALIVPNGSVALRAVNGFVGGGNFGTTAVDPGAVGGVTYSATKDYRGIGVVYVGELSITSGGPVTVRERAFSGGPASYVLANAVGLLGADLSEANQGDAFFFEAAGGGIVGDLTQGVVTHIQPVSSIPYEYQPVITIGAANDTDGFRGAATATLDPVSGAITTLTLASTGLGYTTTSAAAPSVNMAVSGIGLPVVDVIAGTVAAINVGAMGSGYTSVPTVTVVNNPLDLTGAGATYTANMRVARTQIFGGGSGYVIGDVVNFVGGGGAGATGRVASVDLNGAITGITITAGGNGYTSSPTVTVGGAGVGANVTTSLGVGSFTLGAVGAGYTYVPSVVLTGGGLTAASVTLGSTGGVNQISLGTGYTTLAGSVAIADGGTGTGAQAIATGGISRFALAASLDGYVAAPTVTITAPTAPNGVTGKQAQAAAIMGVDTINVTSGGSGYSFSPSVVVSGGGGTGATATVSAFNLVNGNIQILNSGSGYNPLTDVLTFVNGGGAAGTFTVNAAGSVTGINLITPGTTIDPALAFPTVTITRAAPVPGSTDAVLAPLLGIQTIAIANTGLGYTALPSITITDANGAGAAAAVADLQILGMALVDNGAGYQTAPSTAGATITIGANTLGATPTVTSTLSTLFTSTARGANYVEPSVTYAANAGSAGVGGYTVSGFTGGVNGIKTAGGPITLSFNDLEVQGLLPAETGYGVANSTPLTKVDTTSGGANAQANITVRPATGTETGGVSVVNGQPIKGTPVPINIGSTALPDANNGALNLSQGDLDTFVGRQLTIGRNSEVGFEAGPITVTAAVVINPVNVPVMNLVSGGEISDLGAASGIARSSTLGTGVSFRLGLDAFGDIGLVGTGNNTDVLAAQTASRASNIRYVDQTGLTIGTAGELVGILGKTFYLQTGQGLVSGNVGQENGAEILANNFSLRIGTVGAGIAKSQAVLGAENEVTDFAADLNTAAGTTLYFRNSTDLRISSISAGQPGNRPPEVSGIRAASVQIVNGGDLTQQDRSPVIASTSLIISVPDGGNIVLPSSLNNIPANLIVGAVKANGTAGVVNDLNLRSLGGLTMGNTGVVSLDLLTSGAGYTSVPSVFFSGTGGASATAVMSVGDLAISSGGLGYAIAPTVTITPNALDSTGGGASAVATIDSNPLSSTYGQVTSVTLTGLGSNYTLAPTISFSGGGGSGAAASATLRIANLILTASGTTYTTTPSVTIRGGGGTTQGTAQAAITSTAVGLTGNLTLFAGGAITQGAGTANAISVAGNTTLTETSGAGISLANSGNNLVGTLTISQGGRGNVTIVNNNSLALGNVGPVTATPVVAMGNLSLTALSGSIYQVGTGTSLNVGGDAVLQAKTSAGTPNGAVIVNNLGNAFGGSVTVTGTRVVIRDSTALNLGAVTASSSLVGTSTTAGITQSGAINSKGAASFVAAGGSSIDLSTQANTFSSTVSFAALSGVLANVGVRDTTALDLQALTITGNLNAIGAGITQSGALVVPGTVTLVGGAANNITLNNSANNFGTVVITSGNNVTLADANSIVLASGAVSGNLNLNSGISSQTGPITVVGATTVNAGANAIFLNNANNNFGTSINLSNTGANAISVRDVGSLVLGNISMSSGQAGALTVQAAGDITQLAGTTITTGTGAVQITGINGSSVNLGNTGNAFNGTVTLSPSVGAGNRLLNVRLSDTTAFQIQSGLTLAGNLSLTAAGITQAGPITVVGSTTLNGGTGAIVLTNSGNSYGGLVSVTGGASADIFLSLANEADLGPVAVSGTFTLRTTGGTSFNIANGASGNFDVTSAQLSNFQVGTFAPIATGGGDLNLGSLSSLPGIGGISLTTVGGGDINALGAITLNTLELNSSGAATFAAINRFTNLGTVSIGVGGLNLRNAQGLNLTRSLSMPGRLTLEVAGQFYNLTGTSTPLAAVGEGSVIKSLSLMGGLPNLISGLAGFSYRYDGVMPTTGNVMSYAVSPLAMYAPGGTIIAGVDLSGTQTGGGQLNTFLTGSDNLNWVISDFGKFNLPKVEPAQMQYMLYPQRVEPETKSLPQPVMRELTKELGRPPTMDEVQTREMANRTAAQRKSGDILDRSSFDEDETLSPQQEAKAPAPVIDGGKPQAKAEEDSNQPTFPHQVSNQVETKQDPSAPMLRVGAKRAVVMLRSEEKDVDAPKVDGSTQASAKQIIEQERTQAEVGIAPPIAAGK